MSNIKIHTSKDKTWINASGDQVPFKFLPKSDKVKEASAAQIHRAASVVEASLKSLYTLMAKAFSEIDLLVKKEFEIKTGNPKKEGKGSVTWFNFDRSIKIEADVNEICKWDSALMSEALTLLRAYLTSEMGDNNVLIEGLVNDAFANSRNEIDSKKVMQLLKYESKIKNKNFLKSCEIIKQAQSVDKTKLYMRVWEKATTGEYRNINLNFSSL